MIKQEALLELLENCKQAVINQDVDLLISMLKALGVDDAGRSPLYDFTKDCIVGEIKNYMITNNMETLKVPRKNVYHEVTCDWYRIEEGVLKRNGTDTKFSSVGKLYQAYKQINGLK